MFIYVKLKSLFDSEMKVYYVTQVTARYWHQIDVSLLHVY